jgi:hypothetical protein
MTWTTGLLIRLRSESLALMLTPLVSSLDYRLAERGARMTEEKVPPVSSPQLATSR